MVGSPKDVNRNNLEEYYNKGKNWMSLQQIH